MTPANTQSASSSSTRRSIAQVFEDLKRRRRLALMPFIPAGYPDLATTAALLPALERAGADLIEIGIPFSDPIADGPTIQAAFTAALAKKLKLRDIFAAIAAARQTVSAPLAAMVSYSIVYRHGVERFASEARAAGFDALIVPDLPPPEAQGVCAKIRAAGLDTVLLIAPTTEPQRRSGIADLCSGFVYYLSVAGITGERDRLPADLADQLQQIRSLTARPVCVGFGISRPEHVAQLAGVADGAIIGSAIVKRITAHLASSPDGIAQAVGEYCQELRAAVR
jgi:tryptophan synthase alpha chain